MSALLLLLTALSASAEYIHDPPQPVFVQQNFLRTTEIEEMNLDFAIAWTDSAAGLFIQPFDAAVLHVEFDGGMYDVFMITDLGMERIMIWMCTEPDQYGNREIAAITEYAGDDCDSLSTPSGIATSAKNRVFDPEQDFIYLADRGNDRILELTYQPDSEGGRIFYNRSLAQGVVEWPVDLALCAYGGDNYYSDIYVAQWGHEPDGGSIVRLGLDGKFEGSWNDIRLCQNCNPVWPLAKPIGIECFPDTIPDWAVIYVTEGKNANFTYFRSTSDGNLNYRMIMDLEVVTDFWQPGNIACDDLGRIYVVNYAASIIEMYEPFLAWRYESFGVPGGSQELLSYPSNIVFDSYHGVCEALVFENYTRTTGIKTFLIEGGYSLSKVPAEFHGHGPIRPPIKPASLPLVYSLSHAYPNPFNSESIIKFTLPEAAQVTIEVFNVSGQRVARLLDEEKPAGVHAVSFNARGLSSGVYFYKLRAGGFSNTKSIVLVK
jgi:hypothetical protein